MDAAQLAQIITALGLAAPWVALLLTGLAWALGRRPPPPPPVGTSVHTEIEQRRINEAEKRLEGQLAPLREAAANPDGGERIRELVEISKKGRS